MDDEAAFSPEDVVRCERFDDVAVLTVDFPPVNALAAPMRDGLVLHLSAALDDPQVAAIVIIGANDRFIAGADIREFGKPRRGADLLDIQLMMEASGKPIVAAIDGHALGGGLELAMAAPFRVAASPAKLGLPEVNLGLLPGGGGTQRMTRLIGPRHALDLILSGRHVSAAHALDIGLIDKVVDGDLLTAAVAFARLRAGRPGPYPKASTRGDRVEGFDPRLFAASRLEHQQRSRGMVAPFRIIDCIEAACTRSPADGLAFEKDALAACQASPAMEAQVYLFFAERAASKLEPGGPSGPAAKHAILARGGAAAPLAVMLSLAGFPVTLVGFDGDHRALLSTSEPSFAEAAADRAVDRDILSDAVNRVALAHEAALDEAASRIHAEGFPGDLRVILVPPQRVQGEAGEILLRLHGPGPLPMLAEIVRSDATMDGLLAFATGFVKQAKLVPVIAGAQDPGAAHRMVRAYEAVCAAMLADGVAFETLDDALRDAGLQSGRFVSRGGRESWSTRTLRQPDPEEIVARMLTALAGEGTRLVDEGSVRRTSDVDVICVIGLGFPRFRGGPMFWAQRNGLSVGALPRL